jgi:hypothetical protein
VAAYLDNTFSPAIPLPNGNAVFIGMDNSGLSYDLLQLYNSSSHLIVKIDHSGTLTLGTALSVPNGGTGATSFVSNRILLGNGAGMFGTVPNGISGNILYSQGSASGPIWDASLNTDGSGNLTSHTLTTTIIKNTTAQTTLTGSVGTALCSQPEQGRSYKKVVIFLNSYTDTGTQTYTFPTPFANAPFVYGLTAGVTGAAVTTTNVTFTVTGQTGFVFLEGY